MLKDTKIEWPLLSERKTVSMWWSWSELLPLWRRQAMKMALQTQFLSSSSSSTSFNFNFNFTSNVQHTHLLIRSEKASDSAPQKPGVGFGQTKQKDKGRRRDIIRRSPVEKPALFDSSEQKQQQTVEQSKTETAFILAWLGFGAVILVEGIALAASGIWIQNPLTLIHFLLLLLLNLYLATCRVPARRVGQDLCQVCLSIVYSYCFILLCRSCCLWSLEIFAEWQYHTAKIVSCVLDTGFQFIYIHNVYDLLT